MLCSWCGVDVGESEGFRASEAAGERRASFCRLEHIVPWVIQGARWEPGTAVAGDPGDPTACAQCGTNVGDRSVVLVRHRGAHRIVDVFCTTVHLLDWAKAGGRWR